MKTKKYYFILAVLTGILCVPVLGEVELPRFHKPILLARPNPTLAGIEKLYVVIVPPDAKPSKHGLVWKELQAKVESKLKEAGVKITHATEEKFILESLDIPNLRVDISMQLADFEYVFHIQTSLSRAVYLTKEQRFLFKADVWKTRPTMQAASVKDMPAAVTNVVMEQAEAFIIAWSAANPPGGQVSDTNDTSPVLLTTQRQPSKPPAKQTVAKYKYVASKNSKVFHKPDCVWAKRIKPENLIGYNSRAEALKAGKRPCKRCKP